MVHPLILHRRLRRLVAKGVIGALLFAQWAIASYACPMLSATLAAVPSLASVAATGEASRATATIPCADMNSTGDAGFSNLCAEHCKYGQQSDNGTTLSLPAVLLAPLYAVPDQPPAAPGRGVAAARRNAPVAAPPPHAVLHCVYRI